MKKIASLLMMLCIVGLAACSSGKKSPSNIVKNYLNSVQSGDHEKAISYFNADKSEEAELKALLEKVTEMELESYELVAGGETISGDGKTATVEVIMTFAEDDEPTENTFKLVKVNGEWKIDIRSK